MDHYTITETWRILVEARMKERGIGTVELAKAAGVTHGTISHMLKTTRSSPHVAKVHEVLGWPPPAVSEDSLDDDGRLVEIRLGWDQLAEKDKELLVVTFRRVLPSG